MPKLQSITYLELKQRYLQRMVNNGLSLNAVARYLKEDNVEDKQSKKMLRGLELEYREQKEDSLDLVLFEIMEVLKKPTKFSIDKDLNIISIYPHPIVQNQKVTGVEYKPFNNYTFTDDELFNRYCELMDEVDAGGRKGKNGRANYSPELVTIWLKEREQGATYRAIGDRYGVNDYVVAYQIKKFKEKRQG